MWTINWVKDDVKGHNQAKCHECGYKINIDLFTKENLKMIMEAHKCGL
jgi:hypothetical protein